MILIILGTIIYISAVALVLLWYKSKLDKMK